MNELSGKERRREARIQGAIVEYALREDEREYKTAFMKDISLSGVGIFVHEAIQNNKDIYIHTYLFGNEKPIKAHGRVVWQRKSGALEYYQLGIKIVNIQENDRRRLNEYINSFGTEETPGTTKQEAKAAIDEFDVKLKDGIVKHYYGTGELLSEFKIVNGKVDGLKRTYFQDGNLLEEIFWKDGLRHGLRKCYYNSGVVKIEQLYEKGKRVYSKKFNKKGKLTSEEE